MSIGSSFRSCLAIENYWVMKYPFSVSVPIKNDLTCSQVSNVIPQGMFKCATDRNRDEDRWYFKNGIDLSLFLLIHGSGRKEF